MMQRRSWLQWALGLSGAMAAPWAAAAEAGTRVRLGAAWRGPSAGDVNHAGVLSIDWQQRRVVIDHATPLPSRPHGLLAEADGSLLVVAARPGPWLLRLDAQGRVQTQLSMDADTPGRRFDGHVRESADGQWLYTTETDAQGQGWVSVRERHSLRRQDQWRAGGIDPHHMLVDAEGHLLLANGGIPRGPEGRKRDLHRMASSLVRLNTRNGEMLGQWTLPDARLSIRHLAFSDGPDSLVGVALQAEHDEAAQRATAPLLALWNGKTLELPAVAPPAQGYAGDIAPAGLSGFAVSAQRAHQAYVWQPGGSVPLQRIAEVQEPCALAADARGGVLMACGAGVARWHATEPAAMLRWPEPMALDNHWVLMPMDAA